MNRSLLRTPRDSDAQPLSVPQSITPGRRVWQRFRRNRLGFWSLVIFLVAFAISLAGPLWSNDKPLVVRYQGTLYFPLVKTYAETTFGGDFPTPADYLDPYIRDRFSQGATSRFIHRTTITTTRSTTFRRVRTRRHPRRRTG